MELQELMLVLGNGMVLPWVQIFLNKYVPKQYRSISVTVLSIFAGIAWTFVYAGSWDAFLANTAMILTTSQTVYFKVLKEKEVKK